MVLNYMNVLIAGTDIAERLRHKEVRRHWYYNWLGRCERLKTANITPLELTRAQWATSANAKTHYDMLPSILLESKLAVPNLAYDPTCPYSERIKIAKPERICSMDETRLTNDTTSKSKAKINRSIVAKGGSREVLANKGGGDGTGIGGSTADGKDLPAFFIFSRDIIKVTDVRPEAIPVCRRPNPSNPAAASGAMRKEASRATWLSATCEAASNRASLTWTRTIPRSSLWTAMVLISRWSF